MENVNLSLTYAPIQKFYDCLKLDKSQIPIVVYSLYTSIASCLVTIQNLLCQLYLDLDGMNLNTRFYHCLLKRFLMLLVSLRIDFKIK